MPERSAATAAAKAEVLTGFPFEDQIDLRKELGRSVRRVGAPV